MNPDAGHEADGRRGRHRRAAPDRGRRRRTRRARVRAPPRRARPPVELHEASDRLGGRLRLAEAADPDLAGLLDWLVGAAEDAGVTIHLGSPVVEPPDADVLVWAVGAPWPGDGRPRRRRPRPLAARGRSRSPGPSSSRAAARRRCRSPCTPARRGLDVDARPRRRRARPRARAARPLPAGGRARAGRRRDRPDPPADAGHGACTSAAGIPASDRRAHPEVHVIGDAAGTGGLAAALRAAADLPEPPLSPARRQAARVADRGSGASAPVPARWQPARWSSTSPADCMNA